MPVEESVIQTSELLVETNRKPNKKIQVLILAGILIATIGVFGYFYYLRERIILLTSQISSNGSNTIPSLISTPTPDLPSPRQAIYSSLTINLSDIVGIGQYTVTPGTQIVLS